MRWSGCDSAGLRAYFCAVMKLVVEVKDSKAEFFLELLKSLPFVKAQKAEKSGSENAEILRSVRSAVKELKAAKKGKLAGRPIQELLDEL